jgi:hypothetical protein
MMSLRSTVLTRLGVPAIVGAVAALALALLTGLGALGGSSSQGGVLEPSYPDFGAPDKGAGPSIRTPELGDTGTSRDDSAANIVRYGNIFLEVTDADDALMRVTKLVESAGGYLSASSRSGEDENLNLSATFKVPEAKFSEVMASLRAEGKTLHEDISSYEVTMQVVDLEARLKNLRASEAAFLDLLNRAESVADVVAVQTELSRIRGDIESYDSQLNALKDQVAMSSISVTMQLPVSPVDAASGNFDFGYEISNALANLINVGRAVLTAAINIVVIGIPILLIGGLFGSLIGRGMNLVVVRLKRLLAGSRPGARRATRR